MNITAVIPARLDSSRLPNKLLMDICGKSLIIRTYESALKSNLFNDLLIRLQESSPKQKISEIQNKIQYINFNNKNFVMNKLKILFQKLYLLNKILNTTSIERNLKKGYAILKSDNKIVKSVQSLKKLEFFDVTLKDGVINIKKKL